MIGGWDSYKQVVSNFSKVTGSFEKTGDIQILKAVGTGIRTRSLDANFKDLLRRECIFEPTRKSYLRFMT